MGGLGKRREDDMGGLGEEEGRMTWEGWGRGGEDDMGGLGKKEGTMIPEGWGKRRGG